MSEYNVRVLGGVGDGINDDGPVLAEAARRCTADDATPARWEQGDPASRATVVPSTAIRVGALFLCMSLFLATQGAEALGAEAGSWSTWCGGPDRNAVSSETGLVDAFEEWDGKGASARSPIPESSVMPHEEWLYTAWVEGEGIETAQCIWTLLPHRRLRTVEPQLDVHREGGRITLTASAYAHAVGHDDEGGARLSDTWFDLLPGLPKTIVCHGANPDAVRFMYAGPGGLAGLGSGRSMAAIGVKPLNGASSRRAAGGA